MKYLCLVYAEEKKLEDIDDGECGFYLIDARDLNEAIQIAAKIPPARVGSIEVRPVRQLSPKTAAAHQGKP